MNAFAPSKRDDPPDSRDARTPGRPSRAGPTLATPYFACVFATGAAALLRPGGFK